jgi:hypothetical protein
MNKILSESQVIELLSKPILPFLDEYLILSEGITLMEGKEILKEAEEEVKDKWAKLWENYKKKRSQLERIRIKEIEKVGKSNLSKEAKKAKIDEINKKYSKLKTNALSMYKAYKQNVIDTYKNTISKVKHAIWKGGKTGKGMSTIGKFKNLTKLGKAGVIATGALAAGGTYAGYRAQKNRKLALPSKEYRKENNL